MNSLQLPGTLGDRRGGLNHRKASAWIAAAILTCSSLIGPASATAGPVACVQRAIDWKNASTYNWVAYSLVVLHESGEGAYAAGSLSSSICPRQLWAGTISCLITLPGDVARDALLLHPSLYSTKAYDFLRLSFDLIPGENEQEVRLRQPNATYEFYPRCAGNLLVGDDQWGNRWTVAFTLGQTIIK